MDYPDSESETLSSYECLHSAIQQTALIRLHHLIFAAGQHRRVKPVCESVGLAVGPEGSRLRSGSKQTIPGQVLMKELSADSDSQVEKRGEKGT